MSKYIDFKDPENRDTYVGRMADPASEPDHVSHWEFRHPLGIGTDVKYAEGGMNWKTGLPGKDTDARERLELGPPVAQFDVE